jgi:acyl dehydratase
VTVSEAELIDFASRFDPQDFHVDPARAAQSPFGGLIASGWHTSALMMRLYA